MILGVIGLFTGIPSIVALVLASQIKRGAAAAGSSFATLAAAGRAQVLGIVGLFTSVAIIGITALGVAGGGSDTAIDYTRLQPGDCFNRTANGSTVSVVQVSCDQPHNAQVIGRVIAPDGPWPGVAGFSALVGFTCSENATAYFRGRLDPNVIVTYIYPQMQAWDEGSRIVVCDLRTRNNAKVTGQIGAATTAT